MLEDEPIQPEHYDAIVVGSGLPEILVASAFAAAKKSVLIIDPSENYGSEFGSFTLHDLCRRYVEKDDKVATPTTAPSTLPLSMPKALQVLTGIEMLQEPNAQLGNLNSYILDLCPKILYQGEEIVELLVRCRAHHYLEFKVVESCYSFRQGQLRPVPSSKGDIFRDKSLPLNDKRLLMKFLSAAVAAMTGATGQQALSADATRLAEALSSERSLLSVLEGEGLSPGVRDIILYAIAMATSNQQAAVPRPLAASQGAASLRLTMESSGKFGGRTPFMVPAYGCGGLTEAFVRFCAVHGAVTVLRHPLSALKLHSGPECPHSAPKPAEKDSLKAAAGTAEEPEAGPERTEGVEQEGGSGPEACDSISAAAGGGGGGGSIVGVAAAVGGNGSGAVVAASAAADVTSTVDSTTAPPGSDVVGAPTPPDESAPDESAPDESAPDESAPDESAPDESAPDESAPDESAPGQHGSSDPRDAAQRPSPAAQSASSQQRDDPVQPVESSCSRPDADDDPEADPAAWTADNWSPGDVCGVVTAAGQELTCRWLVVAGDVARSVWGEGVMAPRCRLSRAVVVMSQSLMGGETGLLFSWAPHTLPHDNPHPVQAVQVGASTGVAPPGKFLLYLTTLAASQTSTAQEDLEPLVNSLFDTAALQRRPTTDDSPPAAQPPAAAATETTLETATTAATATATATTTTTATATTTATSSLVTPLLVCYYTQLVDDYSAITHDATTAAGTATAAATATGTAATATAMPNPNLNSVVTADSQSPHVAATGPLAASSRNLVPRNVLACPGADSSLVGYGPEVAWAEHLVRGLQIDGLPWLSELQLECQAGADAGSEGEAAALEELEAAVGSLAGGDRGPDP